MNLREVIVHNLVSSVEMFKATIADISDAELQTRATPAANSGMWQIGHLIAAENRLMTAHGIAMPALPTGFSEAFTKDTAAGEIPAPFASKEVLLKLLEANRDAEVAFTKTATDEQLAVLTPLERLKSRAPDVSAVLVLLTTHRMMHLGQIQVLRRKLGKPVLF